MEKTLIQLAFYAFIIYATLRILVFLSKFLMIGLIVLAVFYFVFNQADEPIYDHETTVQVEKSGGSREFTTIPNPSLQDRICGHWLDIVRNVQYHFEPSGKFKIGNLDGIWYLRSPNSSSMILDFHGVKYKYTIEATDSTLIIHQPAGSLRPIIELQKAGVVL